MIKNIILIAMFLGLITLVPYAHADDRNSPNVSFTTTKLRIKPGKCEIGVYANYEQVAVLQRNNDTVKFYLKPGTYDLVVKYQGKFMGNDCVTAHKPETVIIIENDKSYSFILSFKMGWESGTLIMTPVL